MITRVHLHDGNPDWPEGVHPGVTQVVVRGSEKTLNEAFSELIQENLERLPREAWQPATWDQEALIGGVGGIAAIRARAGKQPFTASTPSDVARRFPNLRQIHFWNVGDLEILPDLPPGVETVDLRECAALRRLGTLPGGVTTLILERLPVLETKDADPAPGTLEELSVKGSPRLSPAWLRATLRASGRTLRTFDASDRPGFRLLEAADLPDALEDLRLNGWKELEKVEAWPPRLRRLELRGAERLGNLPDFPDALDFVDLGGMKALTRLPDRRGRPRTLCIYRSGLDLPPELHGADAVANAAAQVEAYFRDLKRFGGEIDNELKLLLLGNGRCGKTSLAKKLLRQGWFNRREDSTHGIRLWSGKLPLSQPGKTAPVNIWDFGGQDLYHNTHRLFLESRAVFLICRTSHPDGADKATDAESARRSYVDRPRPIEYWLEHVEHLNPAPGRETPPPRLRLWTKADRGTDGALEGELPVSARTNVGIDELRRRLPALLEEALGTLGRRTWPRSVLRIKEGLRRLKRAGGGKKHRFVTRKEFAALVRREGQGGAYAEQPDLLLELFHRRGLLFYRPILGDRIILDQRWALDGIYAVFHREQALENLRLRGGEFTAADLGTWVWNALPYQERDQTLFLDFMQACGICFELLPRWETADGKAVYVAVSSLPEEADLAERAARERKGLGHLGTPQVARVTSEGMTRLIAEIGKRWRRAALLWRWGGQIQSYKADGTPGKTMVEFSWKAFGPETMNGELTLQGYGTDFAFVESVLQFFRSEDAGKLDLHAPNPREATQVHIAISFAGDGAYEEDWHQLPPRSKERWPRALAEALRGDGIRVEDYRLEQGRWRTEQTHDRRAYLETVASRDFLVIFVTRRYLESPWCLFEAMRAWERLQKNGGGYDPDRVWVAVFPEVTLSEDRISAWNRAREEFLAFWRRRAREARMTGEETLTCQPWFQFARDARKLESLWLGLMRDWRPKLLTSDVPDEATVVQWAADIRRLIDDPGARRQMARDLWTGTEKGRERRAARLLIEASQMSHPDGWQEHLKQPVGDEVLDAVRLVALGVLAEGERSG